MKGESKRHTTLSMKMKIYIIYLIQFTLRQSYAINCREDALNRYDSIYDFNTYQISRNIGDIDPSGHSRDEHSKDEHFLEKTTKQINLAPAVRNIFHSKEGKTEKSTFFKSKLKLGRGFYYAILTPALRILSIKRTVFQLICKVLNAKLPLANKSLTDLHIFGYLNKDFHGKIKIVDNVFLCHTILQRDIENINYSFVLKVYLKIYSSILFLILDTCLGVLLIYLIMTYDASVLSTIHKYGSAYHIDVLSADVEWLKGLPIGFKSNRNLNHFIGNSISIVLRVWNQFTTLVTPYEVTLLKFFSCFGWFGLSSFCSFVLEVIDFLTIHLSYIQRVLRKLHRFHLKNISTFFHMIKTRKWNIEKKKYEDFDFKWADRMTALILFILLTNCAPTIAMYYMWISLLILMIRLFKSVLSFLLEMYSRFPLCAIIHFIMENEVYPRIACFEFEKIKQPSKSVPYNYLKLVSRPLPWSLTLRAFKQRIFMKKTNTNVARMFKSFIVGKSK
eukprot:TRINITY_DN4780_c0_g2_i2.p1 TRINITY_DN4780_c0_g2~~TRINITY_DN4780_c0_g2_i2.p1  ORF type:complete len:503 (+),score=54.30 TRINITY_DN4780_c0_g2_i2:420-1928(+)